LAAESTADADRDQDISLPPADPEAASPAYDGASGVLTTAPGQAVAPGFPWLNVPTGKFVPATLSVADPSSAPPPTGTPTSARVLPLVSDPGSGKRVVLPGSGTPGDPGTLTSGKGAPIQVPEPGSLAILAGALLLLATARRAMFASRARNTAGAKAAMTR
jgi:hypothetical protein